MYSSIVRISAPAAAVSAADAIATDVFKSEDGIDYIDAMLMAAQLVLDGPSGWLGRAIGQQSIECRSDRFDACGFNLPYPPLVSVTSVKYDDASHAEQTVDPALYRTIGAPETARVVLKPGASWPQACGEPESVRVQYVAGYAAVPAPIKYAIVFMAGVLRDASPSDDGALKSKTIDGIGRWDYAVPASVSDAMERAAGNLLKTYRVYR